MQARHTAMTICAWLLAVPATTEATIIRVELTPELGEVYAPVFQNHVTSLHFPYPIIEYVVGNSRDYKVVEHETNAIHIQGRAGAAPSNINVQLQGDVRVTVRLAMGASVDPSATRVEFYEPGTMPLSRAATLDPKLGETIVHAQRMVTPTTTIW